MKCCVTNENRVTQSKNTRVSDTSLIKFNFNTNNLFLILFFNKINYIITKNII